MGTGCGLPRFVAGPVAGPDVRPGSEDGEEADGLGGFLLAEGDEVRVCQLDLLVVHTITGRLSLVKPGSVDPAFGLFQIRSGPYRLPPDSPFSPHRVPVIQRLQGGSSRRVPVESEAPVGAVPVEFPFPLHRVPAPHRPPRARAGTGPVESRFPPPIEFPARHGLEGELSLPGSLMRLLFLSECPAPQTSRGALAGVARSHQRWK